jgi:hypothetical protein
MYIPRSTVLSVAGTRSAKTSCSVQLAYPTYVSACRLTSPTQDTPALPHVLNAIAERERRQNSLQA